MFTGAAEAYTLIKQGKLAQVKRMKVTENFTWGELLIFRTQSHMRHMTPEIMDNLLETAVALQDLRRHFNRPISVTSGWRDPVTNKAVGGVPNSRHLTGEAADIVVHGLSPKQVQADLKETWPGGLGYGETFTHVDIRKEKVRFGY